MRKLPCNLIYVRVQNMFRQVKISRFGSKLRWFFFFHAGYSKLFQKTQVYKFSPLVFIEIQLMSQHNIVKSNSVPYPKDNREKFRFVESKVHSLSQQVDQSDKSAMLVRHRASPEGSDPLHLTVLCCDTM